VPSCGAVLKDEDLTPAFGPKVDQFVARVARFPGLPGNDGGTLPAVPARLYYSEDRTEA